LVEGQIPLPELRRQDTTNRQKSIDDLDPFVRQKYEIWMQHNFTETLKVYQEMLNDGVAKECARMILPMACPTRIYMSGSVRSWMHYIDLRTGHGTQKEHMELAEDCKKIFVEQFPVISEALEWV
jgi:thymidylate synthase (FAD)